ncbi:MAG: hypothetical protein AAF602_08560 [Myxococcota bacterium]
MRRSVLLLCCVLPSACLPLGAGEECPDPTLADDTAAPEPELCGETVVLEAVAHDDDDFDRFLPIPHGGRDRSDGLPRSVQDGDFLVTAPGRGSGFAGTDEAVTWVFNLKGESPEAWRQVVHATERTLLESTVDLSFTPSRDGGLSNDQLSVGGIRIREGASPIRPWQETGESVWEEGRTYDISVDLLERFEADDLTHALLDQLPGYIPATYADDSLIEEASLRLVYDVCGGASTDPTDEPTGPDLPPTIEIFAPMDADEIVYDGYDEVLELWYADVTLRGEGTDPEDDVVTDLVWTTDRSDLQSVDLGQGGELTVRLYGDDCFGTTHTLTLTGTDSAGNQVQAQVTIRIWTLC